MQVTRIEFEPPIEIGPGEELTIPFRLVCNEAGLVYEVAIPKINGVPVEFRPGMSITYIDPSAEVFGPLYSGIDWCPEFPQ